MIDRIQEAGSNIAGRFASGFSATAEVIDTSGLRDGIEGTLARIRKALPQPKVAETAKGAAPAGSATASNPGSEGSRLAPIVTSLARVGGGGFGAQSTLDAQRENNRLTGETNRLLGDMSRKLEKLGGSNQAAFG